MEELIPTLQEEGEERIDTLQESTIIAGVQTINGKAGDLNLKTINGQDLLTTGNLSLATTEQLATKQDALTETQLTAVNSGIDSAKVGQITTNANNITALQNGKQDNLTQTQLNAVNSGIDETKVAQIATNTENITSNTGRITTIEDKIPSAATSTNQLTDKAYVDNSIATNTANYISDNGQPFQSLADLEAYSGPLTNNDYAFVVSTDAAGNLLYTRYKYNANQELWAEEYTIANPTFTSTQWAAIDSGVTANDVTQIGTNKSDIANLQSGKQDVLSQTQLDAVNSGVDATKVQQIADNTTAIATKQDKLIASTNIQIASDGKTISATDTTYTAGTGLTLAGTQFSVNEPAPSGFFTDTTSTTTGTGSTINLTGTGEAVLDSVKLAGDTFQQSYTGKNKMNATTSSSTSSGFGYSGDMQQIYANGTRSSAGSVNWSNFSLKAGTYILMLELVSGTITSTSTGGLFYVYGDNITGNTRATNIKTDNPKVYQTITVTADTTNAHLNTWARPTETYTNAVIKYQLIEGSTEDYNFEPYVGGIPSPNPDYPQDINVVTGRQVVAINSDNYEINLGKNLFNTGFESGSISSTTGEGTVDDTRARFVASIAVPKSTKFTFSASYSGGGTLQAIPRYYNESGAYVGNAGIGYWTSLPATFTVPSSATRVKLVLRLSSNVTIDTTKITNPQLELGSTATPYAPYFTPIELCKIGTYQDYIYKSSGKWYKHAEIGKVIVNTTNASLFEPTGGGMHDDYFDLRMTKASIGMIQNWYSGTALCEYFSPRSGVNTPGVFYVAVSSNNMAFYLPTSVSDLQGAKDYMDALNGYMYFVLATPTDTAITDSALIAQLEALANARSYNPITNINSSTSAPNLPTILTVDVFKNNWVGTLAGYNEELKRLADKIESLEASL